MVATPTTLPPPHYQMHPDAPSGDQMRRSQRATFPFHSPDQMMPGKRGQGAGLPSVLSLYYVVETDLSRAVQMVVQATGERAGPLARSGCMYICRSALGSPFFSRLL